MNTYAVVFDSDGRVDRLMQSAPDQLPAGMSAIALAAPQKAWPEAPGPHHVLYCNMAGTLLWADPRPAAAKFESAASAVLDRRSALLAATDWVTLRAIDSGLPVPIEWRLYRQALRDITTQDGYPFSVYWPQEPDGG